MHFARLFQEALYARLRTAHLHGLHLLLDRVVGPVVCGEVNSIGMAGVGYFSRLPEGRVIGTMPTRKSSILVWAVSGTFNRATARDGDGTTRVRAARCVLRRRPRPRRLLLQSGSPVGIAANDYVGPHKRVLLKDDPAWPPRVRDDHGPHADRHMLTPRRSFIRIRTSG